MRRDTRVSPIAASGNGGSGGASGTAFNGSTQQRWAAAALSHRRLTILMAIILIIWLTVVCRYYYYYGYYSTLPVNGKGHEASLHLPLGLDPHPPHDDVHPPHRPPQRLPLPPITHVEPSDSGGAPITRVVKPSHSDGSISSNGAPSSSSSTSSELSRSVVGEDSRSRAYDVMVPQQQRRHRMLSPAIVIIAHDRDVNIRKLYDTLITQPNVHQFEIYISCDLPSARDKITSALPSHANVTYWWHDQYAASGQFADWQRSGLFRISYHFKVALAKVFDEMKHSHAILIEEDLVLAPDFLQLFIGITSLPFLVIIIASSDGLMDRVLVGM
jgi:hypothetical protein